MNLAEQILKDAWPEEVRGFLRDAPKFILSAEVTGLINALARDPLSINPHIERALPPFNDMWIEIPPVEGNPPGGFLFRNLIVGPAEAAVFLQHSWSGEWFPLSRPKERTRDAQSMYVLTMAAFVILNTPVVKTTFHDMSRLNKARPGKAPFGNYTTVELALDRVSSCGRSRLDRAVAMVRKHMVRGHIVTRASGKTHWRRPHSRGNADLGIKPPPEYRVVG